MKMKMIRITEIEPVNVIERLSASTDSTKHIHAVPIHHCTVTMYVVVYSVYIVYIVYCIYICTIKRDIVVPKIYHVSLSIYTYLY